MIKMSILGLNLGYTVKYNPSPSRVHCETPSSKGLYLTLYPLSCPHMDTVESAKNLVNNTCTKINQDTSIRLGILYANSKWKTFICC